MKVPRLLTLVTKLPPATISPPRRTSRDDTPFLAQKLMRRGRFGCGVFSLAEQLARLAIDEVKPRACWTTDAVIVPLPLILFLAIERQRGLHIQPRGRAAKNDEPVHAAMLESGAA